MSGSQPLVSVVTPAYNEEEHLAECIESVQAQTYQNWEYIIVNNCSTDRTLEIAKTYAAKDERIRVVNCSEFLPMLANHNRAVRQISPESKYCKVVLADDFIYPRCLEAMVEVAEANPSVGLISAHERRGGEVRITGLPKDQTVVTGRDASRLFFFDKLYLFGSQNSVMYRADLIRSRNPMYVETDTAADLESCLAILRNSDLGFVHEILTFSRPRPRSVGAVSSDMGSHLGSLVGLVLAHGPECLTPEEFKESLDRKMSQYYDFLGRRLLVERGRTFWSYHRKVFENLGIKWSRGRLARTAGRELLSSLLSPRSTWRSIRRYFFLRKLRTKGIRKEVLGFGKKGIENGSNFMREFQSTEPRIDLFGNFGSENFGNEATIEAMLANVRRLVPIAKVRCICSSPEKVASEFKIEAMPISDVLVKPWKVQNPILKLLRSVFIGIPSEIYRWCKAVKTLRRSQMLIVVGTGLLTDSFSMRSWGPYSVFKWSVAAKLSSCRLLFVSTGAGPLDRPIGRTLVKFALYLADFRSYRDEATLEYLKSIGFRTNGDRVSPDLAFSLPFTELPKPPAAERRRLVVGLGLMEFGGMYGIEKTTREHFSAYLETFARFVQWLLDQDFDVRLLTGDIADAQTAQEFVALLRQRSITGNTGARVIFEGIASTEELLDQIAKTDYVVATRFHNLLLSLLLDKPLVAISFHHKCSSLMNRFGLSGYCLDIQTFDFEQLIQRFSEMENNARTLRETINSRVLECRDALEEQYHLIFHDWLPRKEQTEANAVQTTGPFTSVAGDFYRNQPRERFAHATPSRERQ